MSVTPFTVMVAVEPAGTSGAFGDAGFFAVAVFVCAFLSGGAASRRVPQASTVRRLAETIKRLRFTDSSRRKRRLMNSRPEYHRFKCSNPAPPLVVAKEARMISCCWGRRCRLGVSWRKHVRQRGLGSGRKRIPLEACREMRRLKGGLTNRH